MKKILIGIFSLCIAATIVVGEAGTNFVKDCKHHNVCSLICDDDLVGYDPLETMTFDCSAIWSDIKNLFSNVKNLIFSLNMDPPIPPTDLKAEAINSLQVNLTWQDNSDNEMGFKVYQKIGLGGYQLITTLDENTTTHMDIVLISEISYKYKVSVYNDAGESFSDEVNVIVLAQPDAFEVIAFTSNSVNLSWGDNSNYEEGYEIYRKISTETTMILIATLDADETSYEDANLMNCTTYDYVVNAYREVSKSTIRFVSATTPLPPGETTPPTLIPLGDGNYSGSICYGRFKRTFKVHVPPSYEKTQLTPLVLAFHGGGGQGRDQEKASRMDNTSDANGFIVVYPNGTGRSWNSGHDPALFPLKFNIDDVGFVSALIDFLTDEFSINANRIYSTGISNGGIFSYRLASELSTRIAAIASVAGSMTPLIDYHPERPLSVMHFHGTADTWCPWAGGTTRTGTGVVISVQDTINFWIDHNACNHTSSITYQQGDTTCHTYGQGREGTEVVLCTIEEGGHTWPGGVRMWPEWYIGKLTQNISASDAIWDFFVKHPLYVEEPSITIAKPKEDYLYLFDKEGIPLSRNTIVVGKITIEVEAYDEDGIDIVEFYIDDELKHVGDESPYEWLWDEFAIGNHEIKAIAYDNEGNTDSYSIMVWRFF